MPRSLRDFSATLLEQFDVRDAEFAIRAVDRLLAEGKASGVSDLHLQPAETGLEIRYRLDGVLQTAGELPCSVAPNVVARLKVLAGLLTYRTDVPQEGPIRQDPSHASFASARFQRSTGNAVVRFFADAGQYRLGDLGFPPTSCRRSSGC